MIKIKDIKKRSILQLSIFERIIPCFYQILSDFSGYCSITGPLFHFNQLKHAQAAALQRANQAVYQYQQTVLSAFGEVDLALVSVRTYKEEFEQRSQQVQAGEQALILSQARYDRGFTSYLEVLVQQENLFAAQLAASSALQGKLNATVGLYRALGRG